MRRDAFHRAVIALSGLLLTAPVIAGCGGDPEKDAGPGDPPSASSDGGPTTAAEAAAVVRTGVVRIETTDCDGNVFSGSGFMVGPGIVATVAHVVAGANTISLRTVDGVSRGVLEQIDDKRELALLTTALPLRGHEFGFAAEPPQEQQEVVALGYPLGLPLSTNRGQISGLDRRIELERQSLEGLIQTDTALNHGNSGGPLIDASGDVVGVIEAGRDDGQGVAYAIPASQVKPVIDEWQSASPRKLGSECAQPWGDLLSVKSRHPDAPAIAASLYAYYSGINDQLFEQSFALISGDLRGGFDGVDDFAKQLSTSKISDVTVELAERVDETTDTADVAFQTNQAAENGPEGQTCTLWQVRYTMRIDAGFWTIDRATNRQPPQPC